jgi:recombination protein RecA
MPRKKADAPPPTTGKPVASLPVKKVASRTGVLALARAAAQKSGVLDEKEWRVVLDPKMLKESLPHIPTGSLIIDYLIGGEHNQYGVRPCPGLPRGRMTQLWGHEAAGKTTLALTVAASICAAGGSVLYVDWEHEIVPDYAAALGVPITDPDRFELAQPNTLEDGLKLAMFYAAAGVDLIVFDSVGSAVPARIANREISDVGEQARVGELQAVWSQELPNLKRVIVRKGAAVLGISQIRSKISTGPASGGPTTQPQGGNGWKFHAVVRLELRRVKQEKTKLFNALTRKTDDRVSGGMILCKVVKCKLSSSQGREEVFYLRHGEGIDDTRSVMEIATAHGVIHKAGAWLSADLPSGEMKVQGTNALLEHLKKHPDDFAALYNKVTPLLGQRTFTQDDMEELDDVGELLAEVEGAENDGKKEDDEDSKLVLVEDDAGGGDEG